MSCNCHKATPTTACIATFTIGKAEANTTYHVYFETPAGRTDIYPVTSTTEGIVIIENPKVRIGELYELWLNHPADNTSIQRPFIVNDTEVNCINIRFTNCFEYGEYAAPANQSIGLE